jgi:moderate conductance mechanosensitive channel
VPDAQALLDQLNTVGPWIIVLQLLLIVVLTFVALRFARGIIKASLRRLFDREAHEGTAQQVNAVEYERRRQTLEDLTYQVLRIIILVIAFLMALSVLHFDIGPAIAGLGIVGLTISLGAQSVVRDYLAGAFVLIENQYSKGDVVQIAGAQGTVEDISLRRTVLRDVDGSVHFVPNGLIETTTNLSRNWAALTLDLPFEYGVDMALVTAAVDAAAERMSADPEWERAIFEKPKVARVERLAEQGAVVRVTGKVAALYRSTAPGELRGLILEECVKRGLRLGYPPTTNVRPSTTETTQNQG